MSDVLLDSKLSKLSATAAQEIELAKASTPTRRAAILRLKMNVSCAKGGMVLAAALTGALGVSENPSHGPSSSLPLTPPARRAVPAAPAGLSDGDTTQDTHGPPSLPSNHEQL